MLGSTGSRPDDVCKWDDPILATLRLMRHWTTNVVGALEKALAQVQQGLEERLLAARDLLTKAENEFNGERDRLESQLKGSSLPIEKKLTDISKHVSKEEKTVTGVLAELQGIWDRAGQHGKEQHWAFSGPLAPPARGPFQVRPPDSDTQLTPWPQACSALEQAKQSVNYFCGLRKPNKLIRSGKMGCLGVFIAFIVAQSAVSIVAGSTRDGGTLVFTWFFSFIATCAAQILIARGIEGSTMSTTFRNLIASCLWIEQSGLVYLQNLKSDAEREMKPLKARLAQARREHQAALAAAEKRILVPARERFTADNEAAKTWEGEQLRLIKTHFAPVVEGGHQLRDLLLNNLGYIGAEWASKLWQQWQPVEVPAAVFRAGSLRFNNPSLAAQTGLNFDFSVPSLLPLTGHVLMIQSAGTPPAETFALVRSVMLRLLATMPPAKLQYVLIDPIGLGQNVANFTHLADHDDKMIAGRVWTQSRHIEEQLSVLTEHMELVIQKRLRNEYANIAEYNRKAAVPEAYRLLVVLDFPTNFAEGSARSLVSIAQNGPRCGVYSLIVVNPEKPKPYGFELNDLLPHCIVLSSGGAKLLVPKPGLLLSENRAADKPWTTTGGLESGDHTLDEKLASLFPFEPDAEPAYELARQVIESIGKRAKDAAQVKVPFETLLKSSELTPEQWWKASTAEGLIAPLGPRDATRIQELSLGQVGTAHSVLIVGSPGSGKSNLMHVIITGLAIKYSPEEIQLYLVDFKQGVEFQCYARYQLPHARVIAIETEREFGLSVLRGLNREMLDRGEVFRKTGVANISEYRHRTQHPMARVLLIVDEFQVLFAEDDELARECAGILDNLVSQGRNAGIHVVLASQTLARTNSIRKSTMGLMNVRIALQSSEADTDLIMAHGNSETRTLSRPGEAIYNDKAGLLIGNQHFQVALFSEQDRDRYLTEIFSRRLPANFAPSMIVFEGNEPGSIEKEGLLEAAVEFGQAKKAKVALLGEPIEIKSPTVALFRRQSATNLAIISRDEMEGGGMVIAALLSLLHQDPTASVDLVDFSTPDSPTELALRRLAEHPRIGGKRGRRDLTGLMGGKLLNDVRNRAEQPSVGQEMYLVIFGLQRARDLRLDATEPGEDGLSLPDILATLLREGPDVGLHVIAWCDTYSNFSRVIDRHLKREFALRVGGSMSVEDSRELLDDPAAGNLDKPHRAFLYDEERPGILEKFRPYGLPDSAWLDFFLSQRKSIAAIS